MNITTFVKWAAFGVALGGIEDYISRKKGDAIKQKIDEWQAKVEIKRNRTNEPAINYIPEEQPDGSVDLNIGIRLVPNDRLPEGSDAHAVRCGYISIGKVKDRVT